MATPRRTSSGKWELCLRHKLLPTGRKFFTFDTEQEAIEYDAQWRALVAAGLPPPIELLGPPRASTLVSHLIKEWSATGRASATDENLLALLRVEVGGTPVAEVTYEWAERWVSRLKLTSNLAPSSIRQRVGCLARALDPFYRKTLTGNPLRLLPRGYSGYTETDGVRAVALGGEKKVDVVRDRRLLPGEYEKIVKVLEHDLDLRVFFELLVRTGVRLKEGHTLHRDQIQVDQRTIKVRSSKQWRGKVSFRDVPIRAELLAVIEPYLRGRPPERLAFPFWDGSEELARVSNRMSKKFGRVFRDAGIDGLTEHDLRHEATCQWYELRTDGLHWIFREAEINRIMGWAPGSAMAARYASFRAEDLASRLPRI